MDGIDPITLWAWEQLGLLLVAPDGSMYWYPDPPRLGHDPGDEDDGEARGIDALVRTLAPPRRSLPW